MKANSAAHASRPRCEHAGAARGVGRRRKARHAMSLCQMAHVVRDGVSPAMPQEEAQACSRQKPTEWETAKTQEEMSSSTKTLPCFVLPATRISPKMHATMFIVSFMLRCAIYAVCHVVAHLPSIIHPFSFPVSSLHSPPVSVMASWRARRDIDGVVLKVAERQDDAQAPIT